MARALLGDPTEAVLYAQELQRLHQETRPVDSLRFGRRLGGCFRIVTEKRRPIDQDQEQRQISCSHNNLSNCAMSAIARSTLDSRAFVSPSFSSSGKGGYGETAIELLLLLAVLPN